MSTSTTTTKNASDSFVMVPVGAEQTTQHFPIGSIVTILPRTWPGINKPGGDGRVTKCVAISERTELDYNSPYVLSVKYFLGGSDKDIPSNYCRFSAEMEKREVKKRDIWGGEMKEVPEEVKVLREAMKVKKEKKAEDDKKKGGSKTTPKKEEAKAAKKTSPKRKETAEATSKKVSPAVSKKAKVAVESKPSIEIPATVTVQDDVVEERSFLQSPLSSSSTSSSSTTASIAPSTSSASISKPIPPPEDEQPKTKPIKESSSSSSSSSSSTATEAPPQQPQQPQQPLRTQAQTPTLEDFIQLLTTIFRYSSQEIETFRLVTICATINIPTGRAEVNDVKNFRNEKIYTKEEVMEFIKQLEADNKVMKAGESVYEI